VLGIRNELRVGRKARPGLHEKKKAITLAYVEKK
jgi:hypothetical protein